VARKPESARGAQCCRPGLAGFGQVAGGAPFSLLCLPSRAGGMFLRLVLLGDQLGSGLTALLAQPSLLGCRCYQHSGMEPLPLGHSDSPRPVAARAAVRPNQLPPAPAAGRTVGLATSVALGWDGSLRLRSRLTYP